MSNYASLEPLGTTYAPVRGRVVKELALMLEGVRSLEQVAATTNVLPAELLAAMACPVTQSAVDAERLRLLHSGKLAELKAAAVVEKFLTHLQGLDPSELTAGVATKIVELAMKFQGSSTPEPKTREEREAEEEAAADERDEFKRRLWARLFPHIYAPKGPEFIPTALDQAGPPDQDE